MNETDKPENSPVAATEEKPAPVAEPERGFGAAPRLRDLDAQIEDELAATLGGLSDKEMFDQLSVPKEAPESGEGKAAPRARRSNAGRGQSRQKGKIMSIHGQDVFVELPGGRSQGVLPTTQFPEGMPVVGQEVEFQIERYDSANGLLILTRKGAAVEADWSTLAVGLTVEGRVTGTNKGGLSVDVNGIRGFMPVSQIDLYRVEDVQQFVNQKLLCMVTEANPQERNLVVSRRALLEKEREESRDKVWLELAEGQVREGVVRSVREFGAFVDLGGIDGLLHVSEMSWSRVADPTTVVQPGQHVKVAVLKIDREKRKISLGLKQLAPSPWDNIGERFPIGATVVGKVTRLMDFGAFVELEPGVEGLVHISELASQRVRRVGDVVQPGQDVQAVVLRIEAPQRKIALSLKALLPKDQAPEEEEEAATPEPSKPVRPRSTPLRGGIGDG